MQAEPQTRNVAADPTGWGQYFDALKSLRDLRSDSALAALLGVTRSFVSAVRTGRKNVSAELGAKIFDMLGKDISVMDPVDLVIFTPRRMHEKVIMQRVDPGATAQTRKRAAGHCELCDAPAPFHTPSGMPYLEVRLLVPLNRGGQNAMTNMVALCPNCNRKIEVCGLSETDDVKLRQVAQTTD